MNDLAVINTFSVYKLLSYGRADQADFRMDLAMTIINHYVQKREPYSTRGHPSTLPSLARFPGRTSRPVRETPGKKYWRVLLVLQSRQKENDS